MPVPTYLDAVVIGIPLLYGFLGARAGLRRSLVSWQIRWLVALVGAQLLLMLGTSYLIIKSGMAAELRAMDPMIRGAASVLLFIVLLAILLAVTRSVRRRVLDRIGDNLIGPIERTFGGLFGVGCGFLLVAWLVVPSYMFMESFQPDRNQHPAWIRDALSLPYIKSAGEGIRDALMSYVPAVARR